MAQLEVIALDTAVPQLRAPAAGDTYSVPRDMTLASGTTLTAPTVDATTGNITTVNATTIDATNVEVTNVKAKDGTAAITIADSTGAVTVDAGATINGGAVFNETGADVDFRIESDTNSNAFVLDGGNDNVGIGATANAFVKLRLGGTLPTSSNTSSGAFANGIIPSSTTSDYVGFWSTSSTEAASFTLSNANHFYTSGIAVGAGSTVTNQFGFNVTSGLTGATNNYGFYSNIASGSNRWNFYAAGTAANYFAGNVGIGTTSPGAKLTVAPNATTLGEINLKAATGSTVSGTVEVVRAEADNSSILAFEATTNSGNVFNINYAGGAYFKGNVGIGTSSPGGKLSVQDTTFGTTALSVIGFNNGIKAVFGGETGTTSRGLRIATDINTASNAIAILDAQAATYGTLVFQTQSTERMRIDSSGNVGIGGTANSNSKLNITGTLPSSSSATNGFRLDGTIPSASTGTSVGFNSRVTTEAASFTVSSLQHFTANPVTFGAGSTVTEQIGFYVSSSFTGATNNYGFYSNIASGSNRWNLYCAGSADNYMAGDLAIGTTTPNPSGFGITVRGSTPKIVFEPTSDVQSCRVQFALTNGTVQTAIRSGGVEGRDFKFVDEVGAVTRLFIEGSTGNIKIGGTTAARSTTAGTNQLVLFNGTAPVGTLTNGVSFYSASGEANVMDAAGNATLLSPHDSETNEWIFRSKHTPTGKVLKIDVEKMLRFINEHFDLDMVHEFTE